MRHKKHGARLGAFIAASVLGMAALGNTPAFAKSAATAPPLAMNDTITVDYGSSEINFDAVANDHWTNTVTSQVLTSNQTGNGGRWGLASDQRKGSDGQVEWAFFPTKGFYGTVTRTYYITDKNGMSNFATISITIKPPTAPTAADDLASTPSNRSVTIPVVDNDTHDRAVTVKLDTSTAYPEDSGTWWSVNSDNQVVFTPPAGFTGDVAMIQYRDLDTETGLLSGYANINVEVTAALVAPVTVNDSAKAASGASTTIPVLANDTVGSDPKLTLLDTGSKSTGTWSTTNDNKVVFTPVTGFFGSASTSYTVTDATGITSNTSTITATVPAPVAPKVANDSASTISGNAVAIPVLANDTVGEEAVIKLLDPVKTKTGSKWSVNSSNQVVFTPSSTYSGKATMRYDVTDVTGLTSKTATISVTVNKTSTGAPKVSLVDTDLHLGDAYSEVSKTSRCIITLMPTSMFKVDNLGKGNGTLAGQVTLTLPDKTTGVLKFKGTYSGGKMVFTVPRLQVCWISALGDITVSGLSWTATGSSAVQTSKSTSVLTMKQSTDFNPSQISISASKSGQLSVSASLQDFALANKTWQSDAGLQVALQEQQSNGTWKTVDTASQLGGRVNLSATGWKTGTKIRLYYAGNASTWSATSQTYAPTAK